MVFFSVYNYQAVNLLTITPLSANFLDAVVELDRLCFGELWTLDSYRRELASPSSEIFLILTKENDSDKVLGMGCFWSILEEAHITILAIHPDYRNLGLGQLMLYSLLKQSSKQGLTRSTLEVSHINQPALSLYQKFGFQIAGRRKNYYPKTGEDALVLWCKDLDRPEFQEKLALWQNEIKERLDRHNYRIE
jgi:ribosomal-protein-alanine N-acetyltransferase